ncbi:MAG TPA: CPBP family intramembrane glutamic endopeptidase [Actinopolymorphaceae bacterium]
MRANLRDWLAPSSDRAVIADARDRRWLGLETILVVGVTLGYSALRSALSLLDALLRPEPLSDQSVALNAPQAELSLIDLAAQLVYDARMFGFGALALLLLWRSGIALREIGLDRSRPWRDVGGGVVLTALIGVPGLLLYLGSYALGFSLNVQPSVLDDTWWRVPALVLSAVGNSWLEEVVVVAYLLTRLRQLGIRENTSLLVSAVLRGAYHLYQGFGGFVGNAIMGLIFGRVWQRTGRLWPLVIAHALLDIVAFVGYALLKDVVSWLP